ncbi:MAG: dephospho-CoA kinase [Fimbriimonadaceae bacterium]
MALLKAALTGGVAEGKTTVLRMLSEAGLRTGSADEVAREVFEDPLTQSLIAERFGLPGPLDRARMRALITADPDKRRALNEVVHPEILARLVEGGADVIEVPLLVETCLQSSFRRVWVVTCGRQEQLRRLTERLGDDQRARALVSSQLSTEVKCAFADRIVRTDRPLGDVYREAEELARSLASNE